MLLHITEFEVEAEDGTVLHAYDTGPAGPDELVVFWHHGTSNVGSPPEPLFPTSHQLNIRWISVDRPGYGGSTPAPGRTIASAAEYAATVADHLGIGRFAVMGHSGGGTHALACAALMPDRVIAAVSIAGLAPFDADDFDWFGGMAVSGEAALRAAASGREVKTQHEEAHGAEYDPEFTASDLTALTGAWSWLNRIVDEASRQGPGPLIDDDLAYVTSWGFDPADVTAPTLLLHGTLDRIVPCSHSEWLAGHCPAVELRISEGEGHISILNHAALALRWLREQAG